jgi:hypothetical protein
LADGTLELALRQGEDERGFKIRRFGRSRLCVSLFAGRRKRGVLFELTIGKTGGLCPHRALTNKTPMEFASQIAVNRDLAETKTSRFLTL